MKMSKNTILIVFFAVFFNPVTAQIIGEGYKNEIKHQIDWDKLPSHPRLFANDHYIKSISQQKDEVSQKLMYLLKADAEKKLKNTDITYPDGVSNMGTSRCSGQNINIGT
ncbi:hypothetical protein AAKU52_003343 [Pedobacter sp. CG_S7]|uniref:hypothetical protein n=1 Tax=Pedobacter sp. CG_S7 TaxID=3143930 RepID=UPI003398D024